MGVHSAIPVADLGMEISVRGTSWLLMGARLVSSTGMLLASHSPHKRVTIVRHTRNCLRRNTVLDYLASSIVNRHLNHLVNKTPAFRSCQSIPIEQQLQLIRPVVGITQTESFSKRIIV